MMMITIENNLNEIWQVRYRRQLTGSILLYWAMLTLGPLFISLSLFISSYLSSLSWLHGISITGLHRLVWVLPFISAAIAFSFLYMAVPHCQVKLRDAIAGGVVAALLFEVAKHIFAYYMVYFPTYKMLYGALATIPIFLLWVYFSWIIFLLGALVVNGLRLSQAERSVRQVSYFVLAYRVLGRLFAAQGHAQALSLHDLLRLERHCSVFVLKKVLRRLLECKLIYTSSEDNYILSHDLHQLSLHDLYKTLGWYLPESIDTKSLDTDAWQLNLAKVLHQFGKNNSECLQVKMADLYS